MNTDQHIRIAIAEDHQLLRNTLTTVLNSQDDFQVVLKAAHGKELLDGMEKQEVDVVLLDLNMPVLDGREALKVLVDEFPHVRVIIVTMYFGQAYIEKYMKLGAHGYLSKDCAPEHLNVAIRDVYHKGFFVHEMTPISMIAQLIDEGKLVPGEPIEPISEEENEVIRLLCKSKPTEIIALKLEITENVVRDHISRILTKLSAKDTSGILAYAVQNGIHPA